MPFERKKKLPIISFLFTIITFSFSINLKKQSEKYNLNNQTQFQLTNIPENNKENNNFKIKFELKNN